MPRIRHKARASRSDYTPPSNANRNRTAGSDSSPTAAANVSSSTPTPAPQPAASASTYEPANNNQLFPNSSSQPTPATATPPSSSAAGSGAAASSAAGSSATPGSAAATAQPPAADDPMDTGYEADSEDVNTVVDFKGAKQQGKISIQHGKEYLGPESMQGRRTEQVQRHTSNLVLNRLTAEGQKPVEVQTSLVGGTMLINTNNRPADVQLTDGLTGTSLQDYILDSSAGRPAMDRDSARPARYQGKLQDAFAGNRPWQQPGAPGENPADVARANALLGTMRQPGASHVDLGAPTQVGEHVQQWGDAATRPNVVVVQHRPNGRGVIKDEHAERVQSDFRAQHLGDYENADSTSPVGPKTTCLGCQTYHDVHHPLFAPRDGRSGAYFEGSSPATTPAEHTQAIQLATARPATGSISQNGYIRNSDQPDSDSDREGNDVYPRPGSIQVTFDGSMPTMRPWEVRPGEMQDFRPSKKRDDVVRDLERQDAAANESSAQKRARRS